MPSMDPPVPADMSRRARLVAFVCLVALASAGAWIVGGSVLPAFGVPDLYGVAVTSAAGAAVIVPFWVLLDDGFDDRGYPVPARVGSDTATVVASALLVAAALIAAMDAAGVVDGSVRAGESFVAAGPRLVATVSGVGAGRYAFYRRNRVRFG